MSVNHLNDIDSVFKVIFRKTYIYNNLRQNSRNCENVCAFFVKNFEKIQKNKVINNDVEQ